jgi:hypothetical protein
LSLFCSRPSYVGSAKTHRQPQVARFSVRSPLTVRLSGQPLEVCRFALPPLTDEARSLRQLAFNDLPGTYQRDHLARILTPPAGEDRLHVSRSGTHGERPISEFRAVRDLELWRHRPPIDLEPLGQTSTIC